MSTLKNWIYVSKDERPYIQFESSLDDDQVVSGYVPVKSTLDVLSFLKDATSNHASQGRAVICHGSYGSGKSRLCSVIARLFRDGFDCEPLAPVWNKLAARGETTRLDGLRNTMIPGGAQWRPWLVVTAYAAGGGGTFSTCLVRALFKAVERANLDESVLGTTIYHAAAQRLGQMIDSGAEFTPPIGSTYATVDQLKRALEEDFADTALETFRAFYRTVTFGTEFDDWARNSGGISLEAHDVFNTVAENIQRFGYEGVVVIWDEFGFFVEELLRGAGQGTRSLGQEAMSLQNFIERSCGSDTLGRKVLFLGFTHVSLAEYGSRQGLVQADSDRLSTVSDRFRDPSIPVKLSVTENEGYHLLAGMILRTEAGRLMFANPVPKLQKLASKMPKFDLWNRLTAADCYDEIAAPCYPLHPSTSSALLLLSDQVAQRARTTFYYLQNTQNHGLASQLENREAPSEHDIGGADLIRVNDLFSFFEEAIQESKRHLYDQYVEAVARFPNATDVEIAVLRTVLILSVIASRETAPTTDFLSLCLCDSFENELAAQSLHDALQRLTEATSLWKNEATDVWGFVGTQGLATGLEELEEEMELVPANMDSARLLRKFPEVQSEIIDLIGDFDLEPASSGIVRRVGIRLLDISCGEREQALERVNPVKDSATVPWRSALIYLVSVDTETQLGLWRQAAHTMDVPNVYFVIPSNPIGLDRDRLRELIAARSLLAKTPPDSHTYDVLEGKFTRLRADLGGEFQKSFGNEGLRLGTVVVRAGQGDTRVPVSSWSELLPAVADDLDNLFSAQIRVRCGTFNEWKTGQSFAAIEKIVEHILRFDEYPLWHTQFLGFKDSSQEAAIIDGVLVENQLLKEQPLSDKWELVDNADSGPSVEALQEIRRFFQTGTSRDKEIAKLFSKLINAPYGIPNGVIPIMIALVFRAEGSRIGIYSGAQNQRVTDSKLPKAITDMARQPSRYRARYSKLSSKQRIVFCAVGPEMGIQFSERVLRGEAFYDQCQLVRTELRTWISQFPDLVTNCSEFTEKQRLLTRQLCLTVPPQLPVLADHLIEFFNENEDACNELAEAAARTNEFSAMSKYWRRYRTAIERHVDGVRAPLRAAIREVPGVETIDDADTPGAIADMLRESSQTFGDDCPFLKWSDGIDQTPNHEDPFEAVAGAISGKAPEKLTEEDFGKAVGVLEVLGALRKDEINRRDLKEYEIIAPNGKRNRFTQIDNDDASAWLICKIREFMTSFSVNSEDAKSLVIQTICDPDSLLSKVSDGLERDGETELSAVIEEESTSDSSDGQEAKES